MDIDHRFWDTEEIGPIEDLQEIRLEEEDPTRVVKVGKLRDNNQGGTDHISKEKPGCLRLVA